MRLETAALHWLMYVRKCHYAVRERSPRNAHFWEPDAIGVTKSRKLIEVEIKRSMADFRQNADKYVIRNRAVFLDKFPYEFWFLVPTLLVAKVKKELPDYAGLLSPTESEQYPVAVEVAAPRNHESKRLTLKECVKLARCLANHICALEVGRDRANEHYAHTLTYLKPMEYEI
jgi:hypothetical protein